MPDRQPVHTLLQNHFAPADVGSVSITERTFPYRVRVDLQRALNELFGEPLKVAHFTGVRKRYSHEGINLTDLLVRDRHDPAVCVPPQYEEIDIGEQAPIRCLKEGLWLLQHDSARLALLVTPARSFRDVTGLLVQVAAVNGDEATRITEDIFKSLESAIAEARSYRGKVLSLEVRERYSGEASGITVHRLRTVGRDEVILPRKTLELLERNLLGFVRRREQLARYGLPTKKGLLFYGPPGTGKTHTIHYLAAALKGHTTLLISAEQVGSLGEYMTLARLLQPTMVVIEDADLIARDRAEMGTCEEVLLNKLLNEMDGLRENADILFILTTNRPEALEAALSARPGRIDQAIEFPFPDDEGRGKLVRLYSRGVTVPDDVVREAVKRTENVSGAFIKELMRRATQFHLEREASRNMTLEDVECALEEMLFSGGSLNRKLLGCGDVAGG
jgi:chromosomal replication initiation ATPase DnaA